jgi:hypothetical protein
VKFTFKADFYGLMTTFTAERIYSSRQHERFRLTLAGSNESIVIQTNRPAVEGKQVHKAVQWYVVEGKVTDKEALQSVYRKIEETINNIPRIVQGTFNFIDKL